MIFFKKNIQYLHGVFVLNKTSGKMTYSRVSEIVKEKFAAIGLDTKVYHLHSLRAGGSMAAANHQIPDSISKTWEVANYFS